MTRFHVTRRSSRSPRVLYAFGLACLAGVGACGDSSTEPEGPVVRDIFVLNSTGQTLASFAASEALAASAAPVDLGAGFDGDRVDLGEAFAVTTVSSFGGSRVVFVDLTSGGVGSSLFPGPEADLVNPSAASFDGQGTVWIGGRGSDAVYRVSAGEDVAELVASDVGTFIERVRPVGDLICAVDANIDDNGGSYEPLGPGRIVVYSRSGAPQRVIELPAAALNPTDAVVFESVLIVMAAGSFDPGTFLPANDGALLVVDPVTGAVGPSVPLGANGVSLKLGLDGIVYITTTSDYENLDLLLFDPESNSFLRGPGESVGVVGRDGGRVDCWAASGLADGRIACVTFSFAEAGRLVLANPDGTFIDEVASGFGSTDLALR